MAGKSKVAIVTGASRGMGRTAALHLARKGFDLVVAARTVKEGQTPDPRGGSLEKTAAEIQALGRKALVVKLDLLEKKDMENVVQQTMKEFGRIDVLLNNAAKFAREGTGPFLESAFEEYEKEVQANILAPLYFCKLVVPIMIKQGGGIIINMSSEAARWDATGVTVGYAMTKAGLGRQASVLARELKPHNIVVVNLEPGGTEVGRPPGPRDAGWKVSADVPAAIVAFIATHPFPMCFTGKTIDAPIFGAEHALADITAFGDSGPYGPAAWGVSARAPRPLNSNIGS